MLLGFFAVLAVFAGLAAAARMESAGRAERALSAALLWLGAICLPVHVLGWFELLDATTLSLGISIMSVALLLVGFVPPSRAHVTLALMLDTVRVPWDALRESWRERSIAALGLGACTLILLWTAWLAYLAPSSSWDGLMYHEGIVGFSIQNRGFEWVEVPQGVMEQVNGFPRSCEYLALATALLDGKRFMDLVPTVVSPIAILAFYVAIRRFMKDRYVAIAFACGLFLVPAIVLELRSTYVDIGYAMCFAACCHYVTRPKLDQAHAWLCVLAIGLLFGMKVTGLLLAPPLLGLFFLRTVAATWKQRKWHFILTALFGVIGIVALGGLTYLRNWTMKHNVVWPSDLNVNALDIHWHGPWPISNMQHDADAVWKDLFDLPNPTEQVTDSRDNGYGNASTFIMLPLAVLALLALLWRVSKESVKKLFRASKGPTQDELFLTYVVLAAGAAFSQSPAFWWARLNLHIVVVGYLLVAWLLGASRWRRLSEALAGALIVIGLITLHWSTPKWDVNYDSMRALLRKSPEERIGHALNVLTMPSDTVHARETELRPGDVVGFTHHPFVGTLWNEHYTNRVVYIAERGRRFLDALAEAHVKWIVVGDVSSEAGMLRRHPENWERVGFATALNNETVVFRRVNRPELALPNDAHERPTHAPQPPPAELRPPNMRRGIPALAMPPLPGNTDAGRP